MTSRISHTSVDARDAYAQSVWWASVLGMNEDPEDPNEPGHEECMLLSPDGRTRLLFIEVPEAKAVKNRLHLDLRPVEGTRDDEVERLLALGATRLADLRRPDGSGWVTLADPEGNEFCVLRGELEVPDPYARLVTPYADSVLLPQPRTVAPATGSFTLSADLAIDGPPGWAAVVRRLLSPGTGLDLPAAPDGRLRLVADAALAPEAYTLTVSDDGIVITAADDAAVNWATQTLRQLLPASVLRPAPSGEPLVLEGVEISDAPAYAWRGMHLDVARHFMPLPQVFRLVDLAALHKHNVLHLHLTDDQGWRFESLRHPRLQEVASWRTETRRPYDTTGDGTPHGGFYTQAQLRSLVRYAADRGVTVVPELEFPGHVSGVLAAYPELGNAPDQPHATATTFGVFPEVLNLQDAALRVVFDLYEELLEIFPSRYVHVGGDECPRDEWLASPAAHRLAEQRGLAGPADLQRWFTEQLRGWLTERGRVLVGWDEIGDEGPVPGSVVMAWRDARYGREAVAAGLPVVMSPMSHTYFDWYSSTEDTEPWAIGGLCTVEHVYSYDPLDQIPPAGQALVLGTQCQLWTEYVPDSRRAEYLLFPRACAHAEVAWSDPAGRSWAEFEPRLVDHLQRLDALGVDYRPLTGPHPWQQGGTGPLSSPAAHRSRTTDDSEEPSA